MVNYGDRFYICPSCKKEFYIPITTSIEDYAYTYKKQHREGDRKVVKTHFCCSWSCLQALRKPHRENTQHR